MKNRVGVTYHLPALGTPVRWLACVDLAPEPDLPAVYYFECDAKNLCSRAIHIHLGGRVTLAYPGGIDGDRLPEGIIPPPGETDVEGVQTREISKLEFEALWSALSDTADRA